jgi:hypothetical protein
MSRALRLVCLIAVVAALVASAAEAARVRVVHRGPHTRVTVHRGFPIARTLPRVYVRAPRVAVRVAPRVYLRPVVFGATVVALPKDDVQVWREREELDAADEWTDFTLNVDRRGTRLLLEVEDGPAQISFAEVVFENGDAQVVDFADGVHAPGLYSLLDFKDGRKVDHVRVVAKAEDEESTIALRLLS